MESQSNTYEKPVNDYLRVSTVSTEVSIADPNKNMDRIALAYINAKQNQVELLATQELSITGYSAADMFFNRRVIEKSQEAIINLAEMTADGPVLIVGSPIQDHGILYNCAVVLAEGRIAGIIPKTYLPNYNEFYEKRWFTSGRDVTNQTLEIVNQEVAFGTDLLFKVNDTNVGIEICEDGWASIPPSTYATLQGAEVIVNLSASNELTGKADFRRQLIASHTGRLLCAYVYTSAGKGESTADLIFSGHQIIGELGRIVKEVKPFEDGSLIYDIDRTYIQADRSVNTTYGEEANYERRARQYRTINLNVLRPNDDKLYREVIARPFGSKESCEQVFSIASNALRERIREMGDLKPVIGLSGGSDSTLALLLAVEATSSSEQIHTVTMPGPASSQRTQNNANLLAEAIGTSHKVIPINDLSIKFLEAIGHDSQTEDTTYENAQARTRTEILMNYANAIGGFVQGTGDMSENAQGWCTYNADHMSMYNPNANIFKSMVKDIIKWYADHKANEVTKATLYDILATPVSPELTGTGDLSQVTEDLIGPYELHEFSQVEYQRHRSRPDKIGYLATVAKFEQDYTEQEIQKWLESFLDNFIGSQWKRDVMPNGPMIGTIGISPRGPLRMAPNTSKTWSI